MHEHLVLRFDAPLMSFGGVLVDEHGATERWPGLSLVTGLIANALGYDHEESDLLGGLQRRIRFAVRRDVEGSLLRDFHTVDLGQAHLVDTGWTTRGAREGRAGASGTGTHIRYRDYHAGAVYTLAFRLEPAGEQPNLDDVAAALEQPARPLFLGRKVCLPSMPILAGRCKALNLVDALRHAPAARQAVHVESLSACWPADESPDTQEEGMDRVTVDSRDWTNQVHVGSRVVREGWVTLKGGSNE